MSLIPHSEILREYRRLDDTITMRLNRANATMRDQERLRDTTGSMNVQDQACLSVWRELVGEFLRVCVCHSFSKTTGNWTCRTKLVEYCVHVVDQSLTEQRKSIDESGDLASRRKIQAKMFEDEVKVWTLQYFSLEIYLHTQRAQVRNELTVESIVRKRSVEGMPTTSLYGSTQSLTLRFFT